MDHERANNCDCEEQGLAPGWICGKPACHRTLAANANLTALGKKLIEYLKNKEKNQDGK